MSHNESTLHNGETLNAGQFLRSKNGLFHALMQEDGNFVVYRGDLFKTKGPGYERTALWSTGPGPAERAPYHIAMQTDGNVCIYAGDGGATWVCKDAYERRGESGAESRVLALEDSGKLDISGIWNSNTGDGYGDVEFESVEFMLDPAPRVNTKPFSAVSVVGHNDLDIAEPVSLTVSYTDTTSSSWTASTSLKLGTKTTVEAGVPSVVKGQVEVSAEVTTSLAWNHADTHSETKTVTLPVTVEPHKSVQAKCTWKTSNFDIPYRALGKVKFDGYPDMLPVHVEGVYKGVVTHDVEAWWKYVNDESGGKNAAMVASPESAGDAMVELPDVGNRDGWNRIFEVRLQE